MLGKTALKYLLSLSLLFSAFSGVVSAADSPKQVFSDVISTHWAYSSIVEAHNKGYVKGDGTGNFHPNNAVTQVEFLAMLTNAFPDELSIEQDSDLWYSPYYSIADQLNLTYTYDTPTSLRFTRGNLAVMLWELFYGNKPSEAAAVSLILREGISSGKTSATYEGYVPIDTLTRAEAVTFLSRIINYVEKERGSLLPYFQKPVTGKPFPNPNPNAKKQSRSISTLKGVALDSTIDQLIAIVGKPDRIVQTTRLYDWYIYNRDGKHFRYAVYSNEVVGFYSNSKDVFSGDWSPKIGADTRDSIKKLVKSYDSDYLADDASVYAQEGYLVNLSYDKHANPEVIDSIFVLRNGYELGKEKELIDQDAVDKADEQGIFDIVNSYRIKHGLKAVAWSDLAQKSSYKHSKDMKVNGYFDHKSLDGRNPFDRMTAEGVMYSYAGENIAAYQNDDIDVMDSWINSKGHRENILVPEYTHLGVGVYSRYFTQNFYAAAKK